MGGEPEWALCQSWNLQLPKSSNLTMVSAPTAHCLSARCHHGINLHYFSTCSMCLEQRHGRTWRVVGCLRQKSRFLPGETIFRIPANPHTSTPPWHQRVHSPAYPVLCPRLLECARREILGADNPLGLKVNAPPRCPAQTSHKASSTNRHMQTSQGSRLR